MTITEEIASSLKSLIKKVNIIHASRNDDYRLGKSHHCGVIARQKKKFQVKEKFICRSNLFLVERMERLLRRYAIH